MFSKVLIANRGEIATRIARTCKRLGIETVAIYSEAEKDSMHVQACDEAVCVGAAPVRESYLNSEAILQAARSKKAEAIHPGYGLLSENPAFAQAVHDAGLAFVGPSPEILRLFGDKVRARLVASDAGVRCSEASAVLDVAADLPRLADEIGYPLLAKAVAGGGGLGMERIGEPEAPALCDRAVQRRAEAFLAMDAAHLRSTM
ncbi:MAG: hypothetical protein H6715_05485 [Myxococcales bacterium]|nr:hypothetical protein [Myxococcales bacterium]